MTNGQYGRISIKGHQKTDIAFSIDLRCQKENYAHKLETQKIKRNQIQLLKIKTVMTEMKITLNRTNNRWLVIEVENSGKKHKIIST